MDEDQVRECCHPEGPGPDHLCHSHIGNCCYSNDEMCPEHH